MSMESTDAWHPQYFRMEPSSILEKDQQTEKQQTTDTEEKTAHLTAFSLHFAPRSPLAALYGLWQGRQPEPVEISLPSGPWQELDTEDGVPFESGRFQAALTRAAFGRLGRLSRRSPLYAGDDVDAQAVVHLSHGDMVAWLFLLPPVGQGKELTCDQLLQALIEKGVTQGIDLEFLCRLPQMGGRYFTPFPAAVGRTPLPGTDGWVEELFPRTLTPFLSGDLGEANYVTLNLVRKVREGEPICRLHPPTQGLPGRTVRGRTVPPLPVCSPKLEGGRGTHLSPDGLSLLASREGHVQFSGQSFLVQPVLEIQGDVTPSDGVVNFLGDVHISGDVQSGSTLRATGNVQIDGVVEGCTLEAGENLVVSSGIQGQDQGAIRAHKSIFAKYLEHCSAYAGESIYADCIVESNVYSDQCVYACTGRGVILGGTVHAAQTVAAMTVGSKAERPTDIFLGGSPNEEFERAQLQWEEDKTRRQLQAAQALPITPQRKKQLCSLHLALKVVEMKLKRPPSRGPVLWESGQRDPRRLLCDACYPVTTVTIGQEAFRVSQYTAPCAVGLAGSRVGLV